MGFSSPKPPAIKMPPPAAHPPVLGSNSVALAGHNARVAAAQAEGKGAGGTVRTSPQGDLQPTAKARTSLLGE